MSSDKKLIVAVMRRQIGCFYSYKPKELTLIAVKFSGK
jgi:hypothetical protein